MRTPHPHRWKSKHKEAQHVGLTNHVVWRHGSGLVRGGMYRKGGEVMRALAKIGFLTPGNVKSLKVFLGRAKERAF